MDGSQLVDGSQQRVPIRFVLFLYFFLLAVYLKI